MTTPLINQVRTTITFDESVLRDAKQLAAKLGMTLSELVAEAVRTRVAESDDTVEYPPLPTFRSGGLRPGVDLRSNAAIREILDEGLPPEKLR